MGKMIIFDMDGVLVDVSLSYRDTTRKTALIFFSLCKGASMLPDPLFDLKELSFVKQSGGLNNDWDLSHKIITLLMSKVHYLSEESVALSDRKNLDVSALADFLHSYQNPLQTLWKEASEKNSSLADYYYKGDVGSGNIIKQIFQEIYLGKELFEETYKFLPQHYIGDGYILREKLFLTRNMLGSLAAGTNILAIATGRPGAEAAWPLEKHNLNFFKAVLTLDDCLKGEKEAEKSLQPGEKISFSKPHPFMLDIIAELNPAGAISADGKSDGADKLFFHKFYYVGDMPDDMIAAKNSKYPFIAVGVTYSSPDPLATKKRLLESGASLIAETPEELLKILSD